MAERKMEWILSLFSIACHLSALTAFLNLVPGRPYPSSWILQLAVLVSLSLSLSLIFIWLPSRSLRILLFLCQLFFILVILIPAQEPLLAESLVLLVLVLQSGIYFPSILHGSLSIIALSLGTTFLLWIPEANWYGAELVSPGPGSVFASLLLLTAAAVAAEYIKATVQHLHEGREITDSLDTAVSELVKANQSFQDYAQNARHAAALEERKRISREIHDSVGHTLMNIVMMLEAMLLLSPEDNGKLRQYIRDTREEAGRCLKDTRRAVRILREVEPENISTCLRLTRLADTFARATGVKLALELTNTPVDLPPGIGIVLYRSLQEGLTNAFRHGKADRVLVHLQQAGDMIILNITDNGRGSGSSGISEGVGLAGMRERVEFMGGTIHFRNLSGGFKLTVELPKDGLPFKSEKKMVSVYD